ncbi:MAG: glycosyltransferase family 2 protein [Actinobacteria bacterium]|nr:glycosyltransferase family 2 protein [Actinomycetota bacterium]
MTLAPGMRATESADTTPATVTLSQHEPSPVGTVIRSETDHPVTGSRGAVRSLEEGTARPGLSVVMPAYRQARTIREDLARVVGVLDHAGLDFEVIVVVDGYLDETQEQASEVAQTEPRVRVLGYQENRGKGHAVRHGFASARGDLVAFLDAGMDIDPKALIRAVVAQRTARADVVIGSKRHAMSVVAYPPIRRVYSAGYQLLTRLLFGFDVQDTQVGMKLFRREVIEAVAPRLLVKRFAFDVELLAVAHLVGFQRIIEVPVTITHNGFTSSVRLQSVFEMLWDTVAVWYRAKIRRHYTHLDFNNEAKLSHSKTTPPSVCWGASGQNKNH